LSAHRKGTGPAASSSRGRAAQGPTRASASGRRSTGSSGAGGRSSGRATGSSGSGKGGNGRKGGRGGKPPIGRRILKWGLVAMLAGLVLGTAAFAYGYMSTDIPDPNKDFQTETTIVYYADGKTELGRFAEQNRTSVSLSDVPPHVQAAVIAAEDRTFYTNRGIDPKGILRAAFSNARGNATQGASTITQQYVKIFYLSTERTLSRKVREAFLSLKLQQTQSKNKILQGYLNTIYFGRGAYGIQAAAQAYFDKDAKDLSVQEGAVLASILNSPNNYDPTNGKETRERLLGRYQYVVDGMVELGELDESEGEAARAALPKFPKVVDNDSLGGQRGYMLELVKAELRGEGFDDAEIQGGGLRVTSTFTRKAMRASTRAVLENRPPGLKGLHVATASVDPRNGALRGFFAGQDYLKSNGGTNWALAGGAPGSSFKPFALTAGLMDGFALTSTFEGNSPLEVGDTEFENQGEDGGSDYGSAVTMLKATEDSINTAYVDLTLALSDGPQAVVDTAIDMGIPKDSTDLRPEAGVALGSAIVNPIDMASSYGTIADEGLAKEWFVVGKVRSAEGEARYTHQDESRRVVPADVTHDVSYALQQVAAIGSGTNANTIGRPIAGKTGTATNDSGQIRSSWFVGYTPQLSTAVMYVRGKGQAPLDGFLPTFYGGEYPARTWASLMEGALAGAPVMEFPPPAELEATNEDAEELPPPPPPKPTRKPTTPPPTPTPSPTETPTPSVTPTEPVPSATPTPTEPCSGILCDPSDGESPTPPPPGQTQTPPPQQRRSGG
jgi:membrane peptidoglycan carboxypeptidase